MITNDLLTHSTSRPVIDWNRAEELIRGLNPETIAARIMNLHEAAANARDLDRQDNGWREGYYTDEMSICFNVLREFGLTVNRHGMLQEARR